MNNFNRNEVKAYKLGYRVKENGDLIGLRGKPIGSVCNGYHRFKIRKNNGYINCLTHRLQAYQKYGEEIYKYGIVCRHLNGNPLDNSINNIAIGTQSDNMMDRKPEDRLAHSRLASSYNQKHNPDIIKEYYAKEKSYKKTMAHFNISSKGTLHYILNKAQLINKL
jgi:hypothetical protein